MIGKSVEEVANATAPTTSNRGAAGPATAGARR
jgi:hypothetical protein